MKLGSFVEFNATTRMWWIYLMNRFRFNIRAVPRRANFWDSCILLILSRILLVYFSSFSKPAGKHLLPLVLLWSSYPTCSRFLQYFQKSWAIPHYFILCYQWGRLFCKSLRWSSTIFFRLFKGLSTFFSFDIGLFLPNFYPFLQPDHFQRNMFCLSHVTYESFRHKRRRIVHVTDKQAKKQFYIVSSDNFIQFF